VLSEEANCRDYFRQGDRRELLSPVDEYAGGVFGQIKLDASGGQFGAGGSECVVGIGVGELIFGALLRGFRGGVRLEGCG